MAGPSRYPPWLLDFDEDDVDLTIQNSLDGSQSASEDDERTFDAPNPHPDTAFEDLISNDCGAPTLNSARLIPPHHPSYVAAPDRLSLARVPPFRPFRPLSDHYETSSDQEIFTEEDLDQHSAHAPQPLGMDPLTEMQALRARLDMLKSQIPPPNQHNVFEYNQAEDEQLSSHPSGLDEPRVLQDDAWNDLLCESKTHLSSQQQRLRSSLQQPAANDSLTIFTDGHSSLQSQHQPYRRQLTYIRQKPSPRSAQGQSASLESPDRNLWAKTHLETQPGTPHFQRRTVLCYYHPLCGSRLVVEKQLLSSSSVPQAGKKILKKPEYPPAGRFPRGQSLRLLATAAPSTAMQQSALNNGQKRRRIMLKFSASQTSKQASKDEPIGHDPELKPGAVEVLSYPAPPLMPGANVVFLSQLLPKTFSPSKRLKILSTIRIEAPYIPLCVIELDPSPTLRELVRSDVEDILAASSKHEPDFQHPLGPSGAGWPTSAYSHGDHPQALPVEIFELIGSLLPRDSIQSMRLVNREFERKISCLAFKSVVVPFKPKIYEAASTQMSAKAMGKQKEPIKDTYNPRGNHVKDGMRVFEHWGPEIKKFALTFEVAEETLSKLKPKRRFEVTETFWGSYRWPHKHYNRYEQAAKLEQKADETSAMINAFSKLTGIRELGLSVSSGLGWLSGKDASDRAKLFRRKPTVFGSQHALPDRELRENVLKWDAISRFETAVSKRIQNKVARGFFHAAKEVSPVDGLPRLSFRNSPSENSHIFPPVMFDNENIEAKELARTDTMREDEAMIAIAGAPPTSFAPSGVLPRFLTSEQEDWLMEMEWAQEAFLSSWCIALLDNPTVFHSLRTFNIANLSSKHLISLQRDDIWRALPSLQNLKVLVSPDWRRVFKDSQGNVFTEDIRPSSAQTLFWNFLSALFKGSTSNSIKSLTIGYVDGGEHATGMYARNQNILPAPIDRCPFLPPSNTPQATLHLPSVEELTLINCWLTPTTLKNLFAIDNTPKLKSATFDSVSLTANTTGKSLLHVNDDDDYFLPSTDRSLKWMTTNPSAGSWPDIINTITPGPTIAHALLPSRITARSATMFEAEVG
ncbi:hypothetical protein XPA_000322 [Xanthoria parietina]